MGGPGRPTAPGAPGRPSAPPPGRGPAGAPADTGWDDAAVWYDDLVGLFGSEYHREVVIPGVLRLLSPRPGERMLDIACGQGVFCRVLHTKGVRATGIDSAGEMIRLARQRSAADIQYLVADARDLSAQPLEPGSFQAAACVLAIQNIDPIVPVFESAARLLAPGGKLVLAMMHPCFRSPRATSWDWDTRGLQVVQYRRVDRYLLPRKESITTHPGKDAAAHTWTFHRPVQTYIKALARAGLLTDAFEEWPSHKVSDSGPRARAENTARQEIPMFLALRAVKASVPAAAPSRPA
jgi:ubiquinone/menaquinone biosynthesis C-methylase UbiE